MPVLKETLEMLEINEGGSFFFFSFLLKISLSLGIIERKIIESMVLQAFVET